MTSIPWQVQGDLANLRQRKFRAEAEASRTWRDARRAARETRRALRETARLDRVAAKAKQATKPTAATPRRTPVQAET